MRILICDDDKNSTLVMKHYLSDYGDSETAIDGFQAVEVLMAATGDEKPFELITLDIMMPNLDGISVLRQIREMDAQAGRIGEDMTPVIMISALSDDSTKVECYQAGCSAYVKKPVDLRLLDDILNELGIMKRNAH